MSSLSPPIILGNTYHLALDPGTDVLDSFGGLHNFSSWPGALLTDSGGFQMVSLLKLAEITEAGVEFEVRGEGGDGREAAKSNLPDGVDRPVICHSYQPILPLFRLQPKPFPQSNLPTHHHPPCLLSPVISVPSD